VSITSSRRDHLYRFAYTAIATTRRTSRDVIDRFA